jgi:hypothetical protein
LNIVIISPSVVDYAVQTLARGNNADIEQDNAEGPTLI